MHSCIHACMYACIHSFIHSFILSFIHSFICLSGYPANIAIATKYHASVKDNIFSHFPSRQHKDCSSFMDQKLKGQACMYTERHCRSYILTVGSFDSIH